LLMLGEYLASDIQLYIDEEGIGVDPTRILHAIIVGVSFIGAGTIVKSPQKQTIKYLTTAATILFSAGIGISVGLQLYVVAVGLTVLGLIVNTLVSRVYG